MSPGVHYSHVESGVRQGLEHLPPTALDRVDGVFFTGSHHRRGLSLANVGTPETVWCARQLWVVG